MTGVVVGATSGITFEIVAAIVDVRSITVGRAVDGAGDTPVVVVGSIVVGGAGIVVGSIVADAEFVVVSGAFVTGLVTGLVTGFVVVTTLAKLRDFVVGGATVVVVVDVAGLVATATSFVGGTAPPVVATTVVEDSETETGRLNRSSSNVVEGVNSAAMSTDVEEISFPLTETFAVFGPFEESLPT